MGLRLTDYSPRKRLSPRPISPRFTDEDHKYVIKNTRDFNLPPERVSNNFFN